MLSAAGSSIPGYTASIVIAVLNSHASKTGEMKKVKGSKRRKSIVTIVTELRIGAEDFPDIFINSQPTITTNKDLNNKFKIHPAV
jgi:hypothetical protein